MCGLVLRAVSRAARDPTTASHLHPAEVQSSWLDHPGVQGTAGGLVAPHLSGVVLGVPPPRQVQDGGMGTCREVQMRSVPPCRTEHRTT